MKVEYSGSFDDVKKIIEDAHGENGKNAINFMENEYKELKDGGVKRDIKITLTATKKEDGILHDIAIWISSEVN